VLDVEVANVLSPAYTAVIGRGAPKVAKDVSHVATPLPSRVWEPPEQLIEVPLSLKVTVPDGTPVPDCGATVAVKVTVVPDLTGFRDEVSEVAVARSVAVAVLADAVLEAAVHAEPRFAVTTYEYVVPDASPLSVHGLIVHEMVVPLRVTEYVVPDN
jgi:hypothetical protein